MLGSKFVQSIMWICSLTGDINVLYHCALKQMRSQLAPYVNLYRGNGTWLWFRYELTNLQYISIYYITVKPQLNGWVNIGNHVFYLAHITLSSVEFMKPVHITESTASPVASPAVDNYQIPSEQNQWANIRAGTTHWNPILGAGSPPTPCLL